MPPRPPVRHLARVARVARVARLAAVAAAAAALARCGDDFPGYPPPTTLTVGTWGGPGAGVVVADTVVHVHVGCTFGNFRPPAALDAQGRFDVAGSYVLRAYPVLVGPAHPARFAGRVEGAQLTVTVTVTDTVEKRTITLGPTTVTLGSDPQLGPCPICTVPRPVP